MMFGQYNLVAVIMRYYSAKSLNNIFKVVILALFISFSFYSICFSQERNIGRLDGLIQELQDKSPFIRSKAANALGSIGAFAVKPLIAALNNENLEIIAAAYSFFIERCDPGSEFLLVKAL